MAGKPRMGEPLAKRSEATAREVAIEVAQFLRDKKAENVIIFDVEELLPLTSFFVIASAASARALRSLSAGLIQLLKETRLPKIGIEGQKGGRWVCLDYGEVVIHLFEPEERQFYDLDHLWGDAPRVV